MKRKLSFGRDSNGRTSSNGDGGVLRQDQTVSVGDISRTYSANQLGHATDAALHATQTVNPRSNGFSTLANPDNKLVTLGSFASSRMSDLHSETQATQSVRAQGHI
jgi:hypothetical protein